MSRIHKLLSIFLWVTAVVLSTSSAQVDLDNNETYAQFGLIGNYNGVDDIDSAVEVTKSFFDPYDDDMSVAILSAIFGRVGTVAGSELLTGANTLIGGLFTLFNLGILGIAGLMVAYSIVLGTLQSAGEGGGPQKVQPMFVLLRTVLGVSLLVPVSANGYSGIQMLVMYFILSGIGMADTLWSEAMLYINKNYSGGGTVSTIDYSPKNDIKEILSSEAFLSLVKQGHNDARWNKTSQYGYELIDGTYRYYSQGVSVFDDRLFYPYNIADKSADFDAKTYTSVVGLASAANTIASMIKYVASKNANDADLIDCIQNGNADSDEKCTISGLGIDTDSYQSAFYTAAATMNSTSLAVRYNDSDGTSPLDNTNLTNAITQGWAGAARYASYFLGYTCDESIETCISQYQSKYTNANTASYNSIDSYLTNIYTIADWSLPDANWIAKQCRVDEGTNTSVLYDKALDCISSQVWGNDFSTYTDSTWDTYESTFPETTAGYSSTGSLIEGDENSRVWKAITRIGHKYMSQNNEYETEDCMEGAIDLTFGPMYPKQACYDRPRRYTIRMVNIFNSYFLGLNYYQNWGKLQTVNSNSNFWGGTSDFYRKATDCFKKYGDDQDLSSWSQLSDCKILFGVGVYGGKYASDTGAMVNPMFAAKAIGQGLITISTDYIVQTTDWVVKYTNWLTTQYMVLQVTTAVTFTAATIGVLIVTGWWAIAGLASNIFQIMASVFQTLLQLTNFAVGVYMPLGSTIAVVFFGMGALIGVYVPLIPYMVYLFAMLGWLLAVVEAMLAAPLVALGVTHPEGHDLLGKGEQAIMLLITVFIRPSMLVFGLIFGTMILSISYSFLNEIFAVALYDYLPDVKAKDSFVLPIMLTGAGLVYCFLLWSIVDMSYTAVYAIGDKIMRWLGQSPESSMVDKMMGEVKGQFTQAASQAAGGASQVGSKGIQAQSGHFFMGDATGMAKGLMGRDQAGGMTHAENSNRTAEADRRMSNADDGTSGGGTGGGGTGGSSGSVPPRSSRSSGSSRSSRSSGPSRSSRSSGPSRSSTDRLSGRLSDEEKGSTE